MIRQAVVLAGGRASRLGERATDTPKAMQVIAGRPFVDHQLALLKSQGVDHVVLCVGHLGDQIVAHVGSGSARGMRIDYAWDGQRPLGTAGAIAAALPLLDERFWVEYGDTYLRAPLPEIADVFAKAGRAGLMTVYRNDDALDRSNVRFEHGEVIAYDRSGATPHMHHIDFGLSAFRRSVFEALDSNQALDLGGVFQGLLSRKELAAFEVFERFYEIGTPSSLDESDRLLSDLLVNASLSSS